jgi:hypothetical protein
MKKLFRIWKVRAVLLRRFRQVLRAAEKVELNSIEDRVRLENARKMVDYIDGQCDITGKYY